MQIEFNDINLLTPTLEGISLDQLSQLSDRFIFLHHLIHQ